MNTARIAIAAFCLSLGLEASAQTDVSLFWKKDSAQINEIVSEEADQYKKVGHHGPAVENMYMALRLYFNNSGAVDVYSKSKPGLELAKYRWYPTTEEIAAGAGCDEYRVGKTVGLGGVSLWDGEQEVKLVATRGREARVVRNKKGASIEMLSKGVCYKGDTVDILVRITMANKKRHAKVEAFCTTGQKVVFMTGINYHKGEDLAYGDGYMAAWGIHPADIVANPLPIGGGLQYNKKKFKPIEKIDDMLRIISLPTSSISTFVITACSKEEEINSNRKFFDYVKESRFK